MRIGSFFLFLLIALVMSGFFLSDAIHLREDLGSQKKEIEKLTASLQKTEQERQNALTALQTAKEEKQIAEADLQSANQNLQFCRLDVENVNQLVAQLTTENSVLKEQNQSLATLSQANWLDVSAEALTPQVPATSLNLFTLLAVGVGSIVMLGTKRWRKILHPTKHSVATGNYVYLTNDEIKELVQRRRQASTANSLSLGG